MRPSRLLVPAAAAVVALAGGALALAGGGGAGELTVHVLETPGRVLDMETADVDGDGRRDVVATWVPEAAAPGGAAKLRRVSVFLQRKEAPLFVKEPDHTWSVDLATCTLLLGDVLPPAGDDAMILLPDGVRRLPPLSPTNGDGAGGKAQTLLSERTFFTFSTDGAFDVWPLVRDLDGDRAPEIVIPTPTGYSVWGRDPKTPGRLARRGTPRVIPEERFAPHFEQRFLSRLITRTARLSCVVTGDMNGDGRLDLISSDERGLVVFRQRADGSFPTEADFVAQLPKDPGAEKKGGGGGSGMTGGGEEKVETTRLTVEDIDGDGLLDLLAARTGGTIGVFSSMRTRFMVFRGRQVGGFNMKRPDRIVNVRGLSMDPVLADCNGDGKLDMVVSSLRTDMVTNVKRAIVKSVTITYLVFLGTGDGRTFGDEPFFERDVDLDLDHLDKGGAAPLLFFEGDFDGDGKRDLLELTVPEGISWTPLKVETSFFGFGSESLVPDTDARVAMKVPVSTRVRIVDVDGDGRDDVILRYARRDDPERTRLRVLLSPKS